MLKKQNRLSRILKTNKGNIYSSPFFNIKIYEGEGEAVRFGFVVSKKISTKAVVRNKTKRALRDAAEKFILKINSKKDIIIYSKKEIDFKQKEDVLESMADIFKKAKII